MTDQQYAAAKRFLEAIAGYDGETLASLVDLDATLVLPCHAVYQGPEGARQIIRDLARAFTEWKPVPLRLASEGSLMTIEWACTIIDFGGSQTRIDGCTVVDFHGDRIHRARFYFRPEDRQQ